MWPNFASDLIREADPRKADKIKGQAKDDTFGNRSLLESTMVMQRSKDQQQMGENVLGVISWRLVSKNIMVVYLIKQGRPARPNQPSQADWAKLREKESILQLLPKL